MQIAPSNIHFQNRARIGARIDAKISIRSETGSQTELADLPYRAFNDLISETHDGVRGTLIRFLLWHVLQASPSDGANT